MPSNIKKLKLNFLKIDADALLSSLSISSSAATLQKLKIRGAILSDASLDKLLPCLSLRSLDIIDTTISIASFSSRVLPKLSRLESICIGNSNQDFRSSEESVLAASSLPPRPFRILFLCRILRALTRNSLVLPSLSKVTIHSPPVRYLYEAELINWIKSRPEGSIRSFRDLSSPKGLTDKIEQLLCSANRTRFCGEVLQTPRTDPLRTPRIRHVVQYLPTVPLGPPFPLLETLVLQRLEEDLDLSRFRCLRSVEVALAAGPKLILPASLRRLVLFQWASGCVSNIKRWLEAYPESRLEYLELKAVRESRQSWSEFLSISRRRISSLSIISPSIQNGQSGELAEMDLIIDASGLSELWFDFGEPAGSCFKVRNPTENLTSLTAPVSAIDSTLAEQFPPNSSLRLFRVNDSNLRSSNFLNLRTIIEKSPQLSTLCLSDYNGQISSAIFPLPLSPTLRSLLLFRSRHEFPFDFNLLSPLEYLVTLSLTCCWDSSRPSNPSALRFPLLVSLSFGCVEIGADTRGINLSGEFMPLLKSLSITTASKGTKHSIRGFRSVVEAKVELLAGGDLEILDFPALEWLRIAGFHGTVFLNAPRLIQLALHSPEHICCLSRLECLQSLYTEAKCLRNGRDVLLSLLPHLNPLALTRFHFFSMDEDPEGDLEPWEAASLVAANFLGSQERPNFPNMAFDSICGPESY